MTQDELAALCLEWQKRLRLQDWDVEAELVRRHTLDSTDIAGRCRWVLSVKSAYIQVLDPQDFNPNLVGKQDVEEILVHELLHLHFAPFCKIGEETYEQEQAIDLIARALVDAKRGRD